MCLGRAMRHQRMASREDPILSAVLVREILVLCIANVFKNEMFMVQFECSKSSMASSGCIRFFTAYQLVRLAARFIHLSQME